MNLFRITLLVLFSVTLASTAEAKRHHRPAAPACQFFFCPDSAATSGQFRTSGAESGAAGPRFRGTGGQIVGHPSGCPRRAFCGCGAAVRVFGTPRRDLWLAANWLRFPRAAPMAGMVAARRGHVFVLESHVGGSTWIVYDANSGGRATRIHARSIVGYSIVNPRA